MAADTDLSWGAAASAEDRPVARNTGSSHLRNVAKLRFNETWLRNRQHAGSAFHVIANFHFHLGSSREDHVSARAELDHSNTLPALQPITRLLGEHDAARQ